MIDVSGLHLVLKSERIHLFEDWELRHERLLSALPYLLQPTDKVVFGTYGSPARVVEFWTRHALPPDRVTECWERYLKIWKNDSDRPDPRATAILADPHLLRQLADIAATLTGVELLCDHLGAYSADEALLSSHDSFAEPIYVSGDVPDEVVRRFSEHLGVSFRTVPAKEVYTF